ncbi:MAG TPA: AMP-binding protein, partial [Planctomycetaceae bacterium]
MIRIAQKTTSRDARPGELPDGVRTIVLRSPSPSVSDGSERRVLDAEFAAHRHLGRAFEEVARSVASSEALVTAKGVYAYGDLLRAAHVVRDRLLGDATFRAGDRVVVWLPNGPEYVAAFYGTLLAGGVAVPTPPDAESSRLGYVLSVCEARHVLTADVVLRKRPAPSPGEPETLPLDSEDVARADVSADLPDGDAPAAIFFTSGSTGEPKGVTLSHTNLLANARSIVEYLGVTADERALGLLPFYHAFGNSVLQTHLLTGATVVLAGSLLFPETILDAVRGHGVTSLSGVPDLFRTLLSRSSLGETELPSLRYLAVAGGRLDPDQTQVLAFRAAPAKLFVMYGQTEATARLSYLPP